MRQAGVTDGPGGSTAHGGRVSCSWNPASIVEAPNRYTAAERCEHRSVARAERPNPMTQTPTPTTARPRLPAGAARGPGAPEPAPRDARPGRACGRTAQAPAHAPTLPA